MEFVVDRLKTKGGFKYENTYYGFPVITAQEKELLLNDPVNITQPETRVFVVEYSDEPQPEFCKNWPAELQEHKLDNVSQNLHHSANSKHSAQIKLF